MATHYRLHCAQLTRVKRVQFISPLLKISSTEQVDQVVVDANCMPILYQLVFRSHVTSAVANLEVKLTLFLESIPDRCYSRKASSIFSIRYYTETIYNYCP